MPSGSMPVRHYRQSNPGACLPACARIVLLTFGEDRTEQQLASVLGSYEFGTPASHITRLEKLAITLSTALLRLTTSHRI